MNVLVYIPTGLQTPELEIMLAKAQLAIDSGHHTLVATCAGKRGYACSLNIYGLRAICSSCRSQTRRGLAILKGSYEHVETPAQVLSSTAAVFQDNTLKNRWAIKAYRYEKADVGQASYSSYIGLSRDQDLEGRLAAYSLRKLLATSEALVRWSRAILENKKIHKVILYNGRQNQYRPLLRAAQAIKVPVEVMEFSGQHAGCVYAFEDELPQDIGVLNRAINACWQRFSGDIKERAAAYYAFKRSGGVINDTKSYVLGQRYGFLPDNWDENKHNVVIFNSSEDEFAALGGDYDNTLYRNQFEAIERVCDSLHNEQDVVIWLRIHPNLKNVQWRFAVELHTLQSKYLNVHVISGNSAVSSYSLLDACDTAVSFGSTMGMEAAYWGKPSILLGRCAYERLGSVYIPKSHEEVVEHVSRRDLEPLPVEGAHRYALFWTEGGSTLFGFTGNRSTGFKFQNKFIKKNLFEIVVYNFGKILEKAVFGKLINFGLRDKKINHRRQSGSLPSG